MFKTTHKTRVLQSQIEPAYTTAPIEAFQAVPTNQAIWIALPPPGEKCPHTSMCRSMLNSLILGPNPSVQSVSLRKPHAIRGKRLILLSSLLEYIAGVAAAQNNPTDHSASGQRNKPGRQRGRTSKNPVDGQKPSATK